MLVVYVDEVDFESVAVGEQAFVQVSHGSRTVKGKQVLRLQKHVRTYSFSGERIYVPRGFNHRMCDLTLRLFLIGTCYPPKLDAEAKVKADFIESISEGSLRSWRPRHSFDARRHLRPDQPSRMHLLQAQQSSNQEHKLIFPLK